MTTCFGSGREEKQKQTVKEETIVPPTAEKTEKKEGEEDNDIDGCWVTSYGRGAGNVISVCPEGYEMRGAICYENCPDGYERYGAELECIQSCPDGYDGAVITDIFH